MNPTPIVIVTGACGFLGLHVCKTLAERGVGIGIVDSCTYAAVNRSKVYDARSVRFGMQYDISKPDTFTALDEEIDLLHNVKVVAVIHLAAETHVDRSLGLNPTSLKADDSVDALEQFWRTNAIGTARVAQWCARNDIRMIHVSTDEVLGDRRVGPFIDGGGRIGSATVDEADVCAPGNGPGSPYAASKIAAEAAVMAEVRCSGLDAVIVRPTNLYGPGQAADKLIPVAIRKLLANELVPLYGDGMHIREWVHVQEVAALLVTLALDALDVSCRPEALKCGLVHAGGGQGNRMPNAHLVQFLHERMVQRGLRPDGPDYATRAPDRPGHDRAYALDSSLTADQVGWRPTRCIVTNAVLDELINAYSGPPK